MRKIYTTLLLFVASLTISAQDSILLGFVCRYQMDEFEVTGR